MTRNTAQQVKPCPHRWSKPFTVLMHKCPGCGAVERVPDVPVKALNHDCKKSSEASEVRNINAQLAEMG